MSELERDGGAGHTPKSWKAVLMNDQSDSTYIEGPDFSYSGNYCNEPEDAAKQEEIHANAILMAGAQDLLKACRMAEHRYRSMWFDISGPKPVSNARGEWERLKAAISRATGRPGGEG